MAGNAKRLAKNTMFMYIRMFVLMFISLYTSRVLLQQLGVSDYGVYNVVGSIVVMFNSMRGIFSSSTQRYLNIEMGRGNTGKLNTIFNMSMMINLIIAIAFIISVEIVGWWFLNYKINIDPSRLLAAKWVFQFSVLSAVIALLTTPYDAVIIANERMGFYAGMSIVEGLLRLGVVFLLIVSPGDKLISYGLLLLFVQIIVRFINATYCKRNFPESHHHRCWDKTLFKDMASFAGWNFLANAGYSISNEGINMLLNVFGGPVVNAARGITYQVRGALEHFLHNVNKATDPHAMKLFAKGEMDGYYRMMFLISKALFYVYMCLAIPIFFYTEEILHFWLGQIPEYAPIFIRLILIHGIFRSYLPPLNVLFYSANKVKFFQIRSLIFSTLIFVTSWIVLRVGFPYYSAFVVMATYLFLSLLVVLIQAKVLCGFPLSSYLKQVTLPSFLVLALGIMVAYVIKIFIVLPNYWFLLSCLLMILVSMFFAYLFGFNKSERKIFLSIVRKR